MAMLYSAADLMFRRFLAVAAIIAGLTGAASHAQQPGRAQAEIARLRADDDGLAVVVVGLPRHLDGTRSEQTVAVEAFIAELRLRVDLPLVTEDERLSSREAESRLAVRQKDWKKRKAQLDAAAAAVILQDYLDRGGR